MSDSLSLNSAGKENNQNIDRNLSPSIGGGGFLSSVSIIDSKATATPLH